MKTRSSVRFRIGVFLSAAVVVASVVLLISYIRNFVAGRTSYGVTVVIVLAAAAIGIFAGVSQYRKLSAKD